MQRRTFIETSAVIPMLAPTASAINAKTEASPNKECGEPVVWKVMAAAAPWGEPSGEIGSGGSGFFGLATSPPIGQALATISLDRAAGALGIVNPECRRSPKEQHLWAAPRRCEAEIKARVLGLSIGLGEKGVVAVRPGRRKYRRPPTR
jgi:hypothetical protein